MRVSLREGVATTAMSTELPASPELLQQAMPIGGAPLRLPLVGRLEELQRLDALVAAAARGTGGAVLITGRAGVGKSRVLLEAITRARQAGAVVVSATAERGPVLRPHDLVLQVLASAVVELHRGGAQVPAAVSAAMARFETGGDDLGSASSLTALVGALLAMPRRPLMVVVDDVHWADPASAETLRALAVYVESMPVVLVRAQRPVPALTSVEARSVEVIELSPLDESALSEMLSTQHFLDPQVAPVAARALVELGGDVPAVLEHLLGLAWMPGADHAGDGFVARLGQLGAAEPADVMAVRLASLAPWTREVLAVAAVLGREFDVAGLEAVCDSEVVVHVASAIEEACERRVLRPQGAGWYRFDHPLGPEVLYDLVPTVQRELLHRRAAEVLASKGGAHIVGAARHLLAAGGLGPRDVELMIAGADIALERSAFAEALDMYDAVRAVGVVGEQQVAVLLASGRALRGVGRRAEARALFEEVVDAAVMPQWLDYAIEAAVSHAEGGDFRVGAEESAHLIERVLARDGLNDAQRARLLAAQARVSARVDRVVAQIDPNDLFAVGEVATQDRVQWSYAVRAPHAHALSDEALVCAERSQDPLALLRALAAWRSVHRSPHVVDQRTERSLRAIELADRLGRRAEGVELRGWLAVDHLERGDRRAFEVVAQQVETTMGRFGTHPLHWVAACLRTLGEQLDGRPEQIAAAATAAAKVDVQFEVPGRWTALAILLWRAGELADDRSFARSLSSKHPDIFDQVASAAMLGISRARDGLVDEARVLLAQAMERVRLMEVEISWLLGLHAVADLVGELDAVEYAEELCGLLEPWSDRVTIGNHGTVMLGPIARPTATLMALAGAPDEAIQEMFVQAHALSQKLRAPAFVAEAALAEARWHAGRGAVADAGRCANEAIRAATSVGALGVRRAASRVLDGLPGDVGRHVDLTHRQRDILALMSEGLSNPEIARALAFSLSTIAKETSEIYRRLDVPDREAAIGAYRRMRGE